MQAERRLSCFLSRTLHWRAGVIGILSIASGGTASAAPGDVLFFEDFNTSLARWTVAANGGDASLGSETSASGTSLRLRWDEVEVASEVIDTRVPGVRIDLWVRRGDDSFSENPDSGEDLVLEYLNSVGSWVQVQTFAGDETPGEVFNSTFDLDADALHASFQIRLRYVQGSGFDWDYWHVDDITVTETAAVQPFGVGQCMTFESGLSTWQVVASGGDAGVSSATASSGSNSLFTRWGTVSVTSNTVSLAGYPDAELSAWVRRGADAFSENPDNGNENMVIEYFDVNGSWIELADYSGGDTPGEILTPVFNLPADALHSDFAVRFRQTDGGGSDLDYWHVDDVCLTASRQIIYRFEESQWDGTAGEVMDSGVLDLDGSTAGGIDTSASTPAITGNPGTCRYGDFDGVDDFVEIADSDSLDFPDAVSVAVWINARSLPGSDLHTIVSKDWNFEFHINSQGRVNWWWNNESGSIRELTGNTAISLNTWHHVAISYESGSQVVYLDGVAVASSSYSERLRLNDLPLYIGTDYAFISRAWDGFIDEVNIFDRALSATEVQDIMQESYPCAAVSPQFTLQHDGYGIHCVAETIYADVIDAAAGTPLTDYGATVVLDTQSGAGSWQLLSGSGVLSDAVADDGLAEYAWSIGESTAVFALSYPRGTPSIDVDVYQGNDPGIRDSDVEGALEFSPNGFTMTAAPLANPVNAAPVSFAQSQVAGTPFSVYLAAYGQTPDDPTCGVIETYDGGKTLDVSVAYQDPAVGSLQPTINGAAPGPIAVTFSSGQAEVQVKYKDVGRIQLSAVDQAGVTPDIPGGIVGATTGFVVRPYSLALSAIAGAGGQVNPGATSGTGAVFLAAGAPFSVTVTSLDADGDATPSFGQEANPESVALTPALVAPVGGQLPAIQASIGFAAFASGQSTGSDFAWPEVGIISLTPGIDDGDYMGAGDVVGASIGPIGRFVPDHFDAALNSPLFATACSAGGYTYLGEPFTYTVAPEITLTARALGGEATENYSGDFFRMETPSLAAPVYTAATGTLDTSGLLAASDDPAVTESAPGQALLRFSPGSGLAYLRAGVMAPFGADIELSQDVRDADGVETATNPVRFGATSGIPFDSGSELRYGRARLANAFGSERVDLAVALQTEYYLSSTVGFVPNLDDACSQVTAISLGSYTEGLAAGETCVLDNGSPGTSGAGCAAAALPGQQFRATASAGDFNLYLSAPGDGNDGSVLVEVDVPAWLEFDWLGSSAGDEDPSATAVFGIFGGGAKTIYRRELY